MLDMDVQYRFKEIMDTFLRLVDKFHASEKIPRHFGIDEKLHMQEIHTVAAIGETPDMNVTQLSEKLGITKGTVSPIVSKLAQKQLVTKYKGGTNNKEVLLRLTVKGEVAYHAHEMLHSKIHADMYAGLREHYGDITPAHLDFAEVFLHVAEHLIDRYSQETEH